MNDKEVRCYMCNNTIDTESEGNEVFDPDIQQSMHRLCAEKLGLLPVETEFDDVVHKKALQEALRVTGGLTMRVLIQDAASNEQVRIGEVVMESCSPYVDSEGFSRNAHVVIKTTGIIENVVKDKNKDHLQDEKANLEFDTIKRVSYVQSKHLDPSNPVYANSYDKGHLEFDLIQVYSDREFMTQDSDKMPFGHELSIYFTDGSCEVYATCPDLDELEAKIYELVDKFKW